MSVRVAGVGAVGVAVDDGAVVDSVAVAVVVCGEGFDLDLDLDFLGYEYFVVIRVYLAVRWVSSW